MSKKLDAITPGEVLLEEFIIPMNISQTQLAKQLNIPAGRINQIVNNKRSISAETAILLSRHFGTTPQFWLNLQMDYDLKTAKLKFVM